MSWSSDSCWTGTDLLVVDLLDGSPDCYSGNRTRVDGSCTRTVDTRTFIGSGRVLVTVNSLKGSHIPTRLR